MTAQAPAGLREEYHLLRERAGVLDLPFGVIEVSGLDAADYLQGQVTNDVAALNAGEGCYALLLNPKGRILAEMRVLVRGPEQIWVVTEQDEAVLENLATYKIGRRVEVGRADAEVRLVIGPMAREVVGGAELGDREHSFIETALNGAEVLLAATGEGVDIVHHSADAARVAEHLAQAGAEPVTREAAELIRIENGRPRYDVDMTDDNLPGELGLEQRAVSFTKGCYVGQEPVARMYHRGHPNRHLRGLRLSRRAVRGDTLARDGKQIGTITSTGVSPALGPIALALVRREVEADERVAVAGGAEATIVELPFERDGH